MDELIWVYMTAASPEEAERIGTALVEARLAACVNILPGMRSIYRWQGKVERASETVLVAKTRAMLLPDLTERVQALHSYDCPCVIALPIEGGSAAYLDWLRAESGPA